MPLVGCFFCATVLCLRHATPGGSAKTYPPGVTAAVGKQGYRCGSWWCDDCNKAMQLPVEWWPADELAQQEAEKIAKRKAQAEATAGRNKVVREQGPEDI